MEIIFPFLKRLADNVRLCRPAKAALVTAADDTNQRSKRKNRITMKLSEVILQLQKIAEQGDARKDADVQLEGNALEEGGYEAPNSLLGLYTMDTEENLHVILCKDPLT